MRAFGGRETLDHVTASGCGGGGHPSTHQAALRALVPCRALDPTFHVEHGAHERAEEDRVLLLRTRKGRKSEPSAYIPAPCLYAFGVIARLCRCRCTVRTGWERVG